MTGLRARADKRTAREVHGQEMTHYPATHRSLSADDPTKIPHIPASCAESASGFGY
jgi:hypothetical protein